MSIQSEINRISGNVANALTAIANKGVTVPQGSNSDDLATLIAQISGGGTEAISIVDTPDAAGGTVRTITALDISDSTLTTADQLAQGVTAYNKLGVKLTGTGGGGPRQEITGTFTGNGGITQQISCSFAPDVIYVHCDLSVDPSLRGLVSFTIIKDTEICLTADISSSSYSETPLGIARGITGYNESEPTTPHATYSNGVLTLDTANNTTSNRFVSGITYSYELIAYGSSGATQHTIHLEFSDSTDTDIEVDYDDALLGTMITAYQPTGDWTYNSKIVDTAALDNVTWYTRPTETWETLYDDVIYWNKDDNNNYPYCLVTQLGNTQIPVGSNWRVTYNNAQYLCTADADGKIGNPVWGANGIDNGSNAPFVFENLGYGAWTGSLNVPNTNSSYYFKIERQVIA